MREREHLSGNASPCERTMSWLRQDGWTVQKTEHRDFAGVTHDFFGFADIVALRIGDKPLAVQATTTAHLRERIAKIAAEPRAWLWLTCSGRLWVVGWEQVAWGRRMRYEPTVRDILQTDVRRGAA